MEGLGAYQDGQKISFRNSEGTEVFAVTAPVMKDSAGSGSEQVKVKLEGRNEKSNTENPDRRIEPASTCRVTFTMDKSWLEAPERVFPVYLDPVTTTSLNWQNIHDAHVDSYNEADNFHYGYYLKTWGGDKIQRSFVRFQLPDLQKSEMVISASLPFRNQYSDNPMLTFEEGVVTIRF